MAAALIEIREEASEDREAIRLVNDQAFGRPEEGRIIDKIRKACKEVISLVAVSDNKITGHIFFSPVKIESNGRAITGMGLGPMAVLPEFQNQGIGNLLIREGIRRIKEADCPFIIVLGHEHYYPRFGFESASKYGLKPQWEGVPDKAFMVMISNKSAISGFTGVVTYRNEFSESINSFF